MCIVLSVAIPVIDGVPSFAINNETGEITVNSASLDRESIPSYSLIVKVSVTYVIHSLYYKFLGN